jgi:hypothetical protein
LTRLRPAARPALLLVALICALALTALAVAAAAPGAPPVFGPNVKANSDATTYGQHEPSLAVSRVHTNTVVVASKDYRDNNVKHVWIDVSTDGGATWPAARQLQMPGVPPALNIQSDPVVMARDDGRIYVACLATNDSQNAGGIFITWTDDDGASWRAPSVPVFYPENTLDDKDWFAVDNTPGSPYYHRLYMMYAPGAGYVVEQHSTDGGLTWSTRQSIGGSGTEYTYPVIGSDGAVYNFMMDSWGAGRTGTVLLTKSTDGGATWSGPTPVTSAMQPNSPIRGSDSFRFFAILSAAVDPLTSDLYTAWTDNRNFAADGTDVVYVKSTDRGATWGPVTRLSHDPAGVVRDHITPMLSFGADGRLHAFWLDRRLDPANVLFDSWYSSTTDGGATWDPDTRVSTASQNLNIGFPPGSGNAAGDYWGLDTALDTVYAAWTDTRAGAQQDIYVARGTLNGGPTPTPTMSATASPAPPTTTATATPPAPSETAAPPTATAPPALTATAPVPSATATAPPSATPTASATSCAITFTDAHPSDYFYSSVQYLACHGAISGYADGTFRPYNVTTRGQMVKIIVLAFSVPTYTPAAPTFSDVPVADPFYGYIETAAHAGIVSGYAGGTFRPAANVTRGQLSKITVVAAGWSLQNPAAPSFTDVAPGSAFYPFVETAVCHGIVSGYSDRTFRPGADAVRGQIAKIVALARTSGASCATGAP